MTEMVLMVRTKDGPRPSVDGMLGHADDSAFFKCPKCGYFQYLTAREYAEALIHPIGAICPMGEEAEAK